MSILVRRCLSRSRLVEELVENWQIEHKQALFARDVEDLVSESVDLGKLIQGDWKVLLERLFSEQIEDIDAAGEMMRYAVAKTMRNLEIVEKLIATAKKRGYTIQGSLAFPEVVQETRRVKDDLEKKWPWVNPDMVEESLAAYKKGEYRTSEDLLNDSQGDRPETD